MDKYIGVEIGGTKLQLALGTEDGIILKSCRGRTESPCTSDNILLWLKDNLHRFIQEIDQETEIVGIGVGYGGPINTETQTVITSVQVPGWKDFPLKKWFEDEFQIPTRIYNDSSAAGWGEFLLGSGRGCRSFYYSNIGSGIGGCVVVDGKMYDGQGVGAGETGQVRISDWTATRPGADTKLEALCSGWAIEERLRTPGYIPSDSMLIDMCLGNVASLTCADLGTAALRGDAFANAELDHVAQGIGEALSDVMSLLCPQRIAIGGGVSLMGDILIDRIRAATDARVFDSARGRYDIVQCELGESIVLNGAILLAANDISKG